MPGPVHSGAKPIWVTVREAVRISGIGYTRMYELLNSDIIKSIKLGGKRLVSYASIENLSDMPVLPVLEEADLDNLGLNETKQ